MSNDGLNMFETTKLAALLHKVRTPAPERWLGAREALRMATAGGARSARLSNVGTIAAQKIVGEHVLHDRHAACDTET